MIRSAALAGFSIGLAGWCNLRCPGIVGGALFCFGLLTVTHFGWSLYTGVCGFVRTHAEALSLPVVIVGNGAGAAVAALLAWLAQPELRESAAVITAARLSVGPLGVTALAICCGFIMTTAVRHARDGRYLPLLFGVPLFVLCGFAHSIADIFYLCVAGGASLQLFGLWLCAVLGNFIGCNLWRLGEKA